MLSYVRGPDSPIIEERIDVVFTGTASRFPDRLALMVPHQQVELTFASLLKQVEVTAGALLQLGLAPGDRFGVWATNCAEWVYLQLAAARAGLVLVNVNPAYRAHELAYVLKKSGMKALFLHERDRRGDYSAILDEALGGTATGERGDVAVRHVIFIGTSSWDTFISAPPAGPTTGSCHEVANIQYTSGTTGSPKGVLLTHRNLVNNGLFIGQILKLTDADRIAVPVPMYHCFACVGGTMAMVTSGAGMILPAPTFDPLATLQAVERYRATTIYGVPTMFIAELDHPDFARYDYSSLRTGLMAGAPCPIEIMKRVVNEMHCPQMSIVDGQT